MKYFLPCTLAAMACLLSLISFPAILQADSPALESIVFQKEDERELVALLLNTEIEPKIFEIPGEKPRIVLDFINTVYPLKKSTTVPAGGKFVNQIRVGRHAEPIAKTRVVIDVVAGIDYSFVKEFNVSEKTLSIIISPTATEKKDETETVDPQVDASFAVGDPSEQEEPAGHQQEGDSGIEPADQQQEEYHESEPALESSSETDQLPLETIEQSKSVQPQHQPLASGNESIDGELLQEKPKGPEVVLFEVSYEKSTSGNEMVLFRLNGFFPPVVYSSEGNDLYVVCDFLNAVTAKDLAPPVSSGADYIRSISTTELEEPEKVRIIIELFNTYDYDLKQVFFKEDNLFVIILSSLGEKKNQ